MCGFQTKNIPIETILNGEAEKDELRHVIANLEQKLSASEQECRASSEQSAQLQQVKL